jgi:8-oxo-dGTP pyrophosphatase MutT (NUDIX family)
MPKMVIHVVLAQRVASEREVLLLRRTGTGYADGHWGPPAGHVEGDETLPEAAARETREEVGIVIDPSTVRELYECIADGPDGGRHHVFVGADSWSGRATNLEPHRADALAWCRLAELPTPMLDYVGRALQRVDQ